MIRSDELSSERERVSGVPLPAAAQPGQRRVPRVLELGEAELVEDVVDPGSGGHLRQRGQSWEEQVFITFIKKNKVMKSS